MSKSTTFYAIAFGFKKGIFENWDECKKSITGFPQPVYKKFESEDEARKWLEQRSPENESLEVEDKSLDKYYAIARGKNVGIFTEWKTVQENMKGYPNPLYKKHSTYDEALAYFKKFNTGEGESKSEKRKFSSDKSEEEKIVPKKKAK